jgi:hypothetical protein
MQGREYLLSDSKLLKRMMLVDMVASLESVCYEAEALSIRGLFWFI